MKRMSAIFVACAILAAGCSEPSYRQMRPGIELAYPPDPNPMSTQQAAERRRGLETYFNREANRNLLNDLIRDTRRKSPEWQAVDQKIQEQAGERLAAIQSRLGEFPRVNNLDQLHAKYGDIENDNVTSEAMP